MNNNTTANSILIVDDDNSLRQTLGAIVENEGFNYFEAVNGNEACEIYEKEKDKIIFIILDMIMPEMSGYETFFKLKEINKDVRIVIISGYSENEEVLEMLEKGAVGFLRKPFKIKELIASIRQNI